MEKAAIGAVRREAARVATCNGGSSLAAAINQSGSLSLMSSTADPIGRDDATTSARGAGTGTSTGGSDGDLTLATVRPDVVPSNPNVSNRQAVKSSSSLNVTTPSSSFTKGSFKFGARTLLGSSASFVQKYEAHRTRQSISQEGHLMYRLAPGERPRPSCLTATTTTPPPQCVSALAQEEAQQRSPARQAMSLTPAQEAVPPQEPVPPVPVPGASSTLVSSLPASSGQADVGSHRSAAAGADTSTGTGPETGTGTGAEVACTKVVVATSLDRPSDERSAGGVQSSNSVLAAAAMPENAPPGAVSFSSPSANVGRRGAIGLRRRSLGTLLPTRLEGSGASGGSMRMRRGSITDVRAEQQDLFLDAQMRQAQLRMQVPRARHAPSPIPLSNPVPDMDTSTRTHQQGPTDETARAANLRSRPDERAPPGTVVRTTAAREDPSTPSTRASCTLLRRCV